MTEYKSQRPQSLKLDEQGYFEAAFAQLNVIDHDGDVTVNGAFTTKEVPLSAFGHTSWEGAPPVGRGVVSEEGDWAIFKGSFFMDATAGRDAYVTLKGLGDLAEFSYGFTVLDSGPATHGGKSVRELRKLDVMEVSNVLRGAGLNTHLLAIKSGAPGTDASWTERLSWYVDGLSSLLDHGKARADMRASEGRKLSRSDRARLEDLRDALMAHYEEVDGLLVVSEDPKAVTRRRTALGVLIAQARGLGVPL